MFCRSKACSPLEFLHVSANAQTWRFRVLSTITEMGLFLEEVVGALESFGYARKDLFAVRLALEEAIVNAIQHGHRGDLSRPVFLRFCVTAECFLAEVQDQGEGFAVEAVADPAEGRPRGGRGRGLPLMRRYLTWVEHNESGNCVTLCKYRSPK